MNENQTVPYQLHTASKGRIESIPYLHILNIEQRKQNKPRLLDPTHLLTSMIVHTTSKNMVESQANAFLRVSKFNNDVLDRAITDKQSSKIAMKVFSKEVEDIIVLLEAEDEKKEMQKPECERRQLVRTSKFVKAMRNWYLACDACGYTPRQRVHMMQDLYDLLMKDVDFTQYPPPSTDIKGIPIPIVMYEGILQNISLRIAMYKYAKNNSYNQRAISTLLVENFFGDLMAVEFSGLGCPKSTDIMRLMAHVIQLNHLLRMICGITHKLGLWRNSYLHKFVLQTGNSTWNLARKQFIQATS